MRGGTSLPAVFVSLGLVLVVEEEQRCERSLRGAKDDDPTGWLEQRIVAARSCRRMLELILSDLALAQAPKLIQGQPRLLIRRESGEVFYAGRPVLRSPAPGRAPRASPVHLEPLTYQALVILAERPGDTFTEVEMHEALVRRGVLLPTAPCPVARALRKKMRDALIYAAGGPFEAMVAQALPTMRAPRHAPGMLRLAMSPDAVSVT